MNWFVFRQHRKQFLIFGLLLAAVAAFVVPTGLHYWHAYQHALATCNLTNSCDNMDSLVFGSGSGQLVKNLVFATGLFAPVILGVFMGSPLLAREYEDGTDQLVWTQSVSRRKWLTAKLAWALGFALLYGVVLTLFTTWWSRTSNAIYLNRFNTGVFDTQGLVPVAYSMFFTAVGFTIGAWFRKTLVAMAVTLAAFVLCTVTFGTWIRPHYMTPVTVTSAIGPGFIYDTIPKGANWVLTRDTLNGSGKPINGDIYPAAPSQCQQLINQIQTVRNGHSIIKTAPGGADPVDACLNAAGWHQRATYQPSYRYWDFQRIEAGIYLGITAVAVGATYWLVLKRDA